MIRWTRTAALVITLVALGGCGEGYSVEPAQLNVMDLSAAERAQLLRDVTAFLGHEGFEDFGIYEDMISLIETGSMPDSTKDEMLERLRREHTFVNHARDLDVTFADYSDANIALLSLRYTPASKNFVEIAISELRPGGSSTYGNRFFKRFLSTLQKRYGSSVRVVAPPPPNDEAEYQRVTRFNSIMRVVAWCIAAPFCLLFTAPLSVYALRRFTITIATRRIIFVLLNTWLATPMPFPASLLDVLAPNLFAFPWLDPTYYSRVASFAEVSFPCMFLLCAAMSMLIFKERDGPRPAAPQRAH